MLRFPLIRTDRILNGQRVHAMLPIVGIRPSQAYVGGGCSFLPCKIGEFGLEQVYAIPSQHPEASFLVEESSSR